MIEATILMNVVPAKREELRQTLSSMTEDILREEGCTSCKIYQDVNNENIFRLIEEWETQENLDNHIKTEIFSALMGTKSYLVAHPEITIKEASSIAETEDVKKARDGSRA